MNGISPSQSKAWHTLIEPRRSTHTCSLWDRMLYSLALAIRTSLHTQPSTTMADNHPPLPLSTFGLVIPHHLSTVNNGISVKNASFPVNCSYTSVVQSAVKWSLKETSPPKYMLLPVIVTHVPKPLHHHPRKPYKCWCNGSKFFAPFSGVNQF